MEIPTAVWIAGVSTFVTVLLALVNKCYDPIAGHVGYPWILKRSLEELRPKVKTLSNMREDLLYLDPNPSSAECRGWDTSVGDLVKKEEEMKKRLAKGCLSYLKMCKLGKDAEMEVKKATDLITQGNRLVPKVKASHTRGVNRSVPDMEESSHPVQLEEQPEPSPLPGMQKHYDKVLDFIKDNRPGSAILGVWGMVGVGKTTLMKLVRDSRPLYNEHFMEVVLVLAGKGCTEVADLQKVMAACMGLDYIDNKTAQADFINKHLNNKNFLLLVDDLWKDLDLEDVGIPRLDVQPHRRKVVFTTRRIDVCTGMGCQGPEYTYQMKCLSKEDAWNLLAAKVGNTILDHREDANKILDECSGLPMALCTIGKFMSSKKDSRVWRATIDQLKKSKPHHTHEDLFKRLEESYDNLSADMQERFLLCSLWPENENISMEKLIRWWTGLGLLDGFCNANDSGYALINHLVEASMLEKGDTGPDSAENSNVKIHNMIRKMAIGIVNEHGDKKKWLPYSSSRPVLPEMNWLKVEKAWVSHEDTSRWCKWSSAVPFTELKMLVGQHLFSLNLMIRYFQMITFLDLEGMRRGGFPLEICKLTNLQYLNLSATRIDVLPLGLNKLIYLKYLYIRNNMHLRTIPEGLILALKSLQGLDLFGTGASFLSVLKELANFEVYLDMLGFTVRTTSEITQLGKLKRVCTQALCMKHFEDERYPNIINLQILSKLEELRELAIVEGSRSQKVLVAEGGLKCDQQLLPRLVIFELNNLLKLEKVIWKNAGTTIRVVSIYNCDGLKDVTWVHRLKLLEQLTVAHCKEMGRLIETRESPQGEIVEELPNVNQTVAISFPKLKKLKLEDLPKLSMISEQACEFEELSYICVTRCDNIKNIRNHMYKQSMVTVKCSEDWWNGDTLGFIPCLVPTFCSKTTKEKSILVD